MGSMSVVQMLWFVECQSVYILCMVPVYVTEEVEELSGRLKASRQRVAELEKSFTSASSLNQKNEKVSAAPHTATLSCHKWND